MFGSGVNLGNAYGSIVIGTGDISKAIGNAKNMLRAGFADMSGMAKSWGGDLIQSGATLGLATAPLAIGFAKATKDMAEFDKTMALIGTNLLTPVSQLGDLREKILSIGGNSVEGVNAAGRAFTVVSGGIQDTTKQMEVFITSQKLAEAGAATWEAASNGLVAMMGAYGDVTGTTADSLSDMFIQSSRMGREQLDVVIPALSSIAATAKLAGASYNQMGKEVTYLEVQGASQSAAAIRWQAATMAFIKPNETLAKAVHDLGYESAAAMYKQEGLTGSLKILTDKFGSSAEAMSPFFSNLRAYQGVAGLLNKDTKEFFDTFDSGLAGITDRSREINLESITAQASLAGSKLEEMGIRISLTLLPSMNKLIDMVKPILFSITEWIKLNPDLTAQIALAAAALVSLAPVLITTGSLLNMLQMGIGFLSSPIGLVSAALGLLYLAFKNNFGGLRDFVQPILDRFHDSFSNLESAWAGFLDMLSSGTATVENVGKLFGYLVEQIVFIVTGSTTQAGEFRRVFESVFGKVASYLMPIFERMQSAFTMISAAFTRFFGALLSGQDVISAVTEFLGIFVGQIVLMFGGTIEQAIHFRDVFVNALTGIIDFLMPIIERAISVFGNIVNSFFNFISNIAQGGDVVVSFTTFLSSLVNQISYLITGSGNAGRAVWEAFNSIGEIVSSVLAVIWPIIQNVFGSIVDIVVNIVIPAMQKFGAWFMNDGLPAIIGIVQNLWPIIEDVFNTLWSIIQDTVMPILEKLWNWFLTEGWPAIVKIVQELWPEIEKIWDALVGIIRDVILPLLPKLQNAFTFLWNGAADILQTVWPQIKTVLDAFIHIIQDMIMPVVYKFLDWFLVDGLPWIVKQVQWFINDIWTPLFNVIVGLWTAIEPGLTSFFNWFVEPGGAFDSIKVGIQSFMDQVWEPLKTGISNIWSTVSGALISLFDWFTKPSTGWSLIFEKIYNLKTNLWEPFVNLLKSAWNSLSDPMSKLGNGLKNMLKPFSDFMEDLKRKVDEFFGKIQELKNKWDQFTGQTSGSYNQENDHLKDLLNPQNFAIPAKATGGNTSRFATYRINENGMEYLSMNGNSGNINLRPNGGGGEQGLVFNAGSIVINADTYEGGKAAARGFSDEFMEKYRSRG